MGYRTVDTDDLELAPDRPCDLRRISEAAGLEGMAVNRFSAEPGEQLPLAYHYHEQQEELFYVLAGTLHVETPDEEFVIDADGVFACDPESPQRAFNPADADAAVEVLAVGVPPVDGDAVPYEGE
ncbi:MAG: cupin domain-containing protein [Haloferacaceae archaeon]